MLVSESNIEAAMARIERCDHLTVDLETTGLRPYQGDRLFGVAIEAEGAAYYFPFRHRRGRNLPAPLLPQLLDILVNGKTLLGHNFIRFDTPMLAMEDEALARVLLDDDGVEKEDTIIDALLANENEQSFSLEALGLKYLGGDAAEKHKRNEELLDRLRRIHPKVKAVRTLKGMMADLTPEEVAPYACGDVLDTRALRNVYRPHLQVWGLGGLSREMYRYARLLAKIERRGLLVDKGECERRVQRCEDERHALLTKIRAAAGATFNPQSPAQICRYFGTDDAEAATLRKTGHALAELVIQYKQLGKMATTYYGNMLERMDENCVIHPQLNLTRDYNDRGGTRSARLSCSNPNFQNLPKHSDKWWMRVREVVKARPGNDIIAFDYERMEMWLAGCYSGDQSLFEAYHDNRDLYAELAQTTGTTRQGGKQDWLTIQYGGRGRKLSEIHGWPFISVKQLEKEYGKPCKEWNDAQWRRYMGQKGPSVVKAFFDLCPGIKQEMAQIEEEAKTRGFIRLWTGRVVHFDGVKTPAFKGWSRKVQGGAGEMVRVAMQRLEPMLDEYGAGMLTQVHDEIVIEAPEEHRAVVVRETRRIMTDFDLPLRPRVDPKIGKSYGAVADYKEAA